MSKGTVNTSRWWGVAGAFLILSLVIAGLGRAAERDPGEDYGPSMVQPAASALESAGPGCTHTSTHDLHEGTWSIQGAADELVLVRQR